MITASVILLAHPLVGLKLPSLNTDIKIIKQDVVKPIVHGEKVGLDKCKTCIDFADQALNQLLNIILRTYITPSISQTLGGQTQSPLEPPFSINSRLMSFNFLTHMWHLSQSLNAF